MNRDWARSVAFFLFISVIPVHAIAATEASTQDQSVRKMGVAWNIADDREIQNINGIYEPEGLDKYMQRYFHEITKKLDELSMKTDKLSEKLEELKTKINLMGKNT